MNDNFYGNIDILSRWNNTNLIFLFNTNNNPNLNINGNVVNVVRSTLNKWIYTYAGQSNIFYRYDNFSSFDVATAWTCEGWLYLNSLSSNVVNILSTTDLNNYNTTGKIEFGYKNNQLTILKAQTNFNRLANIKDVAELTYFLCSNLNTSITGQFINIDLGFSNAKII